MAANVETMAYTKFSERDVPWHGLGVNVDHYMTSEEALIAAGLNWKVQPQPMFINFNGQMIEIPNVIANVRDSDGSVLGTVTDRYNVCQNSEAFEFTDTLLGMNVQYDTAGSLNDGKRVWMLAKMPGVTILDDEYVPYLLFVNNHDGKGSIKVATVPIRIVCSNTANLALSQADRFWSTRHMGNLSSKMAEAHRTLELANNYLDNLKIEADNLYSQKINTKEFEVFMEMLLPVKEEPSERQIKNITDMRNELSFRYFEAPDLADIRNTKWGVMQAVSDFATHREPQRASDSFKENLFGQIINGHVLMDKAFELLTA